MRWFCLVALIVGLLPAQTPVDVPPIVPPAGTRDLRLPNGKWRGDEIAKADYKKNLVDAAQLVELTQEIRMELEQSDPYIVPLKTIKKLEDLEKLSRNVRGRLKRN